MERLPARVFSNHHIFVDYYDNAEAAESVEQVEEWAKQFINSVFYDEYAEEDYPDGPLAQKVIEASLEELPEYLASEAALIRDLACKRYMQLKYGHEYTTWYVDIWNYLMCDNAETHGTFMAMCFKSENEELHALGTRVWADLKQIQGGGTIWFDT